jgi:Flp pilus assembly protein TadG
MRRLTTHQRDDHGVGTIFIVLAMLALLVGVAFATDVGRYVVEARRAQNSADATVLALATDCVFAGGPIADYSPYRRADQSINPPVCGSGKATITVTTPITDGILLKQSVGEVDRSATARFGELTSGVIFPFTFSACAFPDTFTQGNATTPGTYMMLYGQGVVRTSCPRDGDTTGQDANSKGFVAGGCQLTSVGGTLTDAQGNSFIGTNCDSANIDDFVGKDVLLPVWGAAAGTPSDYTITNLVGFHVLGWSANGSNRGGDMSGRCKSTSGFTGDPATVGDDSKPCLYGYVTSFTSAGGGTSGAPCFSNPLSSACFIGLDS